MSASRFKQIKALTELLGVVAVIYAMSLGADPETALALGLLLVGGPEYAEYILSGGGES